jgi:putative peptide zinc metalloprotease protein
LKKVQILNCCNVEIEYFESDDIYLFNPKNDKMIKADPPTFEFIKNYDSHDPEQKVPGLENFLFGKKKINWMHFKIIRFEIPSQVFNKVNALEKYTFFKIFFITSVLFFLLSMPFIISRAVSAYQSGTHSFSFTHLIYIYLAQLIIIMLHEFGHYYSYNKYIGTTKMRFGVLVRYLFLLLFYNNVNFMRTLEKREKLWITISGVLTQLFAGGILAAIYLMSFNNIILYIYAVNILIAATNLLPFLRLDGYWALNLLISSEDYMREFKNWIFKRKRIRKIEFVLGVLNLLLIIGVLSSGLYIVIKMAGEYIL